MRIILGTTKDIPAIAHLAHLLWPHHTLEELTLEITELFSREVFFLAYLNTERNPVGFCQVSLRHDYVEGTSSSPVGYLEGIFVKEDFRKKGMAKALIEAAENWAKKQGCLEFASDTSLENVASQALHEALNFKNKEIIVHYSKRI